MKKEKKDDLKRLVFAEDIVQKNLINEILNENGITTISKASGLGGTFGYSAYGEELYVKESVYDQALKVLQELEQPQDVDQEELEQMAVSVEPEDEINVEETKFEKVFKEFPRKIVILLVVIIVISMLFMHQR